MSSSAATILGHLDAVNAQRARRAAIAGLEPRVVAIKAYQQRRFTHTYADLLQSARHGPASRFFLQELYGPTDFTRRDGQFARVVPALVRLFPSEIVETVAILAELHAMSEALDTDMAVALTTLPISAVGYIAAWQQTGRPQDRERQIALTVAVAGRLDRLTRRALVRNSLRLMRGPARASGLGELQQFLEAGFDTFRAMGGATEFIAIVETRERALARLLFGSDPAEPDGAATALALDALP